jgi:hydroxymethylpyrimidine/phosphomethylpyrimidine kinase
MAISTAATVQNGLACFRIAPPALNPVECLEALRIHLTGSWGVKLGLSSMAYGEMQELMRLVDALKPICRIWDPVQAPTSGVAHHDPAALKRMATAILGRKGWVVSPNRLEAAAISGESPDAVPQALADGWLELGAKAVWLKGGHTSGAFVEDFWIDSQGVRSLGKWARLPGERRGTGCTLAAAWLGLRLQGLDDVPAAEGAGAWIRERWASAVQPGGVGRPCFWPVQE